MLQNCITVRVRVRLGYYCNIWTALYFNGDLQFKVIFKDNFLVGSVYVYQIMKDINLYNTATPIIQLNTTGLCSQFYFLSQTELKIYTQKYAIDYRFFCRFLGMLLKSLHECVQDSFSLGSIHVWIHAESGLRATLLTQN